MKNKSLVSITDYTKSEYLKILEVARDFEKKSYQDISDEMHLSLDQVRSHIQNGRRNLKKCLETKQKLGPGKNI